MNLRTFPFLLFVLNFCGLLSLSADFIASSEKDSIVFVLDKRYQKIEGFGSCIINYRDFPSEYSDPNFFDVAVNDLGISIIRVPLMEHAEWKNDDDDPNHFNWNGFWISDNIDRKGMETSLQLMQKFKEQGVDRFMATPWSPPEFMKTQRSPIQGGYLRADMFEEYAEYMAAQIILAKKNYGIDINWVTMQNELLFAQFFRSCVYQPWVLKEALRALMHKFNREGINTRILMPEDMFFTDRMLYYIQPTMNDPETKKFNGHFTTHRRGGKQQLLEWVSETNQHKRQNWMTETSGHEPTWEGALKLATDIQDYLVYGNFSAWVYWQLSGGGNGRYSIMVNGKPGNKYYASKHFYRYVRPNAHRIATSTNNDNLFVSAFHHPFNGTLTIVVINNSETTAETKIKGDYTFDVYQSTKVKQFYSSKLNPGELLKVPAKSITTLYVKNGSLKTGEQEPILPQSWDIPKNMEAKKLGNSKPFPRKRSFQVKPDGGNISIYNDLKSAEEKSVLDERLHNGWSLLHLTIMNGDGDAVKYLIDNGADVNLKANDGYTPLHMAASTFSDNLGKENRVNDFNKYDIFKLIMEANPDLAATTRDGWTPLHAAVANAYTGWRSNPEHSLKRIRDLIQSGVELEAKDSNGRTALHWACMQGYLLYSGVPAVKANVVDLLLEKDASIDEVDNNGDTPLHHAIRMGYPEITLALINADANSGIKNKDGKTPREIAKKAENESLLYILDHAKMPEDLKATSEDEIPGKNEYKYGPELIKAAWKGDRKEVLQLLEKGADVEYRDMDGFNALQRARDSGHKEIVKILRIAIKKND